MKKIFKMKTMVNLVVMTIIIIIMVALLLMMKITIVLLVKQKITNQRIHYLQLELQI